MAIDRTGKSTVDVVVVAVVGVIVAEERNGCFSKKINKFVLVEA